MAFLGVEAEDALDDALDDSVEVVALVGSTQPAGMGWHLEDTEMRRQQAGRD